MLNPGNIIAESWRSGAKNKLIYFFCITTMFFMLFDGIMTYLIPLVILEHGFSKTLIGIILGTAAVSGAFFDFVIYKIFKEAHYRRLFIIMFAICSIYILTLWVAESFVLYVAAMAMWGFYYDLKNFGTLDFVSRYSPNKKIPSNFGKIQVFQAIGYLLAPLIAGFVIIDMVDWEPFAIAAVFLAVSAFFFIILTFEARKKKQFIPHHEHSNKVNFSEELARWKKIGYVILPVLVLASIAAIFDSFFIAIGPILAETLPLEPFDGIFMFAYFLPPLIIGSFIGSIANRFGEKKTALFGLLIGALILSTMFFFDNPFEIIFIVFLSSCFTCMILPVVQSIYAKCIRESPKIKKEVQELGDFFGNFGYIIGLVAAGAIADIAGNTATFSILGAVGVACALLLFLFMPDKIHAKRIRKK